MKIHRGFPPKLDWLKIEESGRLINLTTYGHKVWIKIKQDDKDLVDGVISFDELFQALSTIKPTEL